MYTRGFVIGISTRRDNCGGVNPAEVQLINTKKYVQKIRIGASAR
jgi:hypothetical protein